MACDCFNCEIPPGLSLQEKLSEYQCKCNARFVVKEKNKSLEITNTKLEDLYKIKIDNFVIKDTTNKKCDYHFRYIPTDDFIFVELKGSDISRAVKQILNTIIEFRKENIINSKVVTAIIISSKAPSNSSTTRTFDELLRKELKKFNYTPYVRIKNIKGQYNPVLRK